MPGSRQDEEQTPKTGSTIGSRLERIVRKKCTRECGPDWHDSRRRRGDETLIIPVRRTSSNPKFPFPGRPTACQAVASAKADLRKPRKRFANDEFGLGDLVHSRHALPRSLVSETDRAVRRVPFFVAHGMIMLIPSRFRVSQLVAITSPARPKYACRRSRPAVAVRPLSTKFLHDTRTFGIAGVAAGFGIMNPHDHIIIGERNSWGDPVTFGISPTDRRQHLYVIGKTGSGKTTLLRNLIVQHIAAGHGVGLIDPHGDLAEELLDHIPPARTDDLVYFHPGDLGFPVGLNLFANVLPDDRHLVASGIVGAFKSIWRDSWGPRLEYILYNAIAALLDCENMTLLGVNRLLTDPAFRSRIVLRIRDPFIRDFWENEFASYDPRFQREAIAPIQNKLGQFLLNPVVRNILGQVKSRVSIGLASIKWTEKSGYFVSCFGVRNQRGIGNSGRYGSAWGCRKIRCS